MTASIALCTFNGAAYLPAQLQSILGQSLPPLEVVVRDDGSSDETPEILERFQREAPFSVRLLESNNRLGSTKNFERVIAECKGDYIFLADQDDVWHPDKLQRITDTLQTHSKACFAFSNAQAVDPTLAPLGFTLWSAVRFVAEGKPSETELLPELVHRNVVTGATMCFRSALRESIPPAPDGWVHDHWIAWCLSIIGPSVCVNECLVQYRQHANQQIGIQRHSALGLISTWFNTNDRDFIARLESIIRQVDDAIEILQTRIVESTSCATGNGLQNRLGLLGGILESMLDRRRHLRNRIAIRQTRILNLKSAVVELGSGRYRHFGNGTMTALRDWLRL